MSNEELVKQHEKICEQLNITYEMKNKDYGDSFSKSIQEFGNVAALTRMFDKWNRIKQLSMSGTNHVKDESLIDSCLDLANYLIMYVMELQKGADNNDRATNTGQNN